MKDSTHLKANAVHISIRDLRKSHFGLNLTLSILEFLDKGISASDVVSWIISEFISLA